jgi:hypothetical protein
VRRVESEWKRGCETTSDDDWRGRFSRSARRKLFYLCCTCTWGVSWGSAVGIAMRWSWQRGDRPPQGGGSITNDRRHAWGMIIEIANRWHDRGVVTGIIDTSLDPHDGASHHRPNIPATVVINVERRETNESSSTYKVSVSVLIPLNDERKIQMQVEEFIRTINGTHKSSNRISSFCL